jgi:hypothetical protein
MIFFLNKNTNFCWEITKIFESWGVRTLPHPVVATSLGTPGEFSVKKKIDESILRIHWSTQFFALIPNMLLVLGRLVGFVMETSVSDLSPYAYQFLYFSFGKFKRLLVENNQLYYQFQSILD